jgi:hypothetical protein
MEHGFERPMVCFPLFLRGVLGKTVCNGRYFDGKNTVKCTANTVKKLSYFAV